MELKIRDRVRAKMRRSPRQKGAYRECRGLLRKRQWKFPDENDSRIYKNRKRPVLKFTRQIAAYPRVRAQDRPIPLRPAARHVSKHRQN